MLLAFTVSFPDPPHRHAVWQSIRIESGNIYGCRMVAVNMTPGSLPVRVRRTRRVTHVRHRRDGLRATRRPHRDDWRRLRLSLSHVDLDGRVFAQTPPIPSGCPPSNPEQ